MSRGLGQAQQAIMDALGASNFQWETIPTLAVAVSRTQRQVLEAVRALESRGLVALTPGNIGWSGAGEYGREVPRNYSSDGKGIPTSRVVHEGEPWPGKPGYVARRDVEFYRQGMPRYGLQVWLPAKKDAYDHAWYVRGLPLYAALGDGRTPERRESDEREEAERVERMKARGQEV